MSVQIGADLRSVLGNNISVVASDGVQNMGLMGMLRNIGHELKEMLSPISDGLSKIFNSFSSGMMSAAPAAEASATEQAPEVRQAAVPSM